MAKADKKQKTFTQRSVALPNDVDAAMLKLAEKDDRAISYMIAKACMKYAAERSADSGYKPKQAE